MRIRLVFSFILILVSLSSTSGQTSQKPLILPVASQPGPSTWLLGQAYGNTVGAFNFGDRFYSAGQGLHFGIDLWMPCGTPLVAVADGEVAFADNLSFGSAPHNLILRHPQLGLTSLYGHLLNAPSVVPGQQVKQGQVVAYSGDPDETCESRPHLHLEIRSADYRTTFNPVTYTDANWNTLATIGSFSYPLFQQDLYHARRWLSLDDQPNVSFGGIRLNDYTSAYPPSSSMRPPINPPLMRQLLPLSPDAQWQLRRIGYDSCCWNYEWHPTKPDSFYVIDGLPGERAMLFEWSALNGIQEASGFAPPGMKSPDGTHEILFTNGIVQLQQPDGFIANLPTDGRLPGISINNSQLMWVQQNEFVLPGQEAPDTNIFISDINGENVQQIVGGPGTSAVWLDATRLLILQSIRPEVALSLFDTTDYTQYPLGVWRFMRQLTIAPGGGRLMFYLSGQKNLSANGIYTIETQADAIAEQLPFWGAWHWRDADSVYYIPFDISTDTHQLAYYHMPTHEDRTLTDREMQPFTIMNGVWSVSADGSRILFHNAVDRNLWLLELIETP